MLSNNTQNLKILHLNFSSFGLGDGRMAYEGVCTDKGVQHIA